MFDAVDQDRRYLEGMSTYLIDTLIWKISLEPRGSAECNKGIVAHANLLGSSSEERGELEIRPFTHWMTYQDTHEQISQRHGRQRFDQ